MFTKILYVLIFLVIAIFVFNRFIIRNEIVRGDQAPDFQSELINGENFGLSDLNGNYILIDFWASWCGPCLREHPKMVALNYKYKDEIFDNDAGFNLVTIALEKNDLQWKRVADRFGFDWKYQIVEESRFVLLSGLAQKYNVKEVPSKFLINPEGKIIAANVPFEEIDKVLSNHLK